MDFSTKEELLDKLRAYAETPDDDTIRLKRKIEDMLKNCPELLYSLHREDLESELFDENGNLMVEGDWSAYFGATSAVRPFLSFPTVETDVHTYLCYQVSFDELPRYNNTEKYCLITFTIFVYNTDIIDDLTGIPRHDLIGSIIRELMAWSGITMSNAVPVSDKESTTDNNYIVRTMVYQATMPNSIVKTENGITFYSNKGKK